MAQRRQRQSRPLFSGKSIITIISLIVIAYILFTIFKSILWVLGLLSPFLFVGALILNYKVVTGFASGIINGFKTKPGMSIAKIFAVIFVPYLVAAYLFAKALISRKIVNVSGKKQKEYDDYEVVEEEDDDFLDLPELEKVPSSPSNSAKKNTNSKTNSGNTSSNEYEDLF